MTNNNQPNENSLLLVAFRAGDKNAFAALVKRNGASLHYHCLKLTDQDSEAASDLLQEAYLDVYSNIEQYACNEFTTLVYNVAKYISATPKECKIFPIEIKKFNERKAPRSYNADNSVVRNDLTIVLTGIIEETLSPPMQDIMKLYAIKHLTVEAIAERMGMRVDQISSHIHRAAITLKTKLANAG